MNTTALPADTLFGQQPPAVPVSRGLAPAAARLVTTSSPDQTDPEKHPLLLLVVTCPYCDHTHIHAAGHTGAPRLCIRRSRCVGTPGGAYYFPQVVQQ